MANRGEILDPHVFTVNDLKERGSSKLPKMYRGDCATELCCRKRVLT